MADPRPTRAVPRIVVLGRDWCEDTLRSRAWLDTNRVQYEYRNVEIDAEADALIRSFNGGGVVTPTILLGDAGSPPRVLVEPTDADLARAIAEASADG
jgi:glutaredoxin